MKDKIFFKILLSLMLVNSAFEHSFGQAFRQRNIMESDYRFINMNVQSPNDISEIDIILSGYDGSLTYTPGEIFVITSETSGGSAQTVKISHPSIDFRVRGTCNSMSSVDNIVMVGTAKDIITSNEFAFFIEYDRKAKSIISFNAFNSSSNAGIFTFLDVAEGWSEYVIVGYWRPFSYFETQGAISIISGFNFTGNPIWTKQYRSNNTLFRNAFESVKKHSYEVEQFERTSEEVSGNATIKTYLVSGVATNNWSSSKMNSSFGVFDFNSKSFLFFNSIALWYGSLERAIDVFWDEILERYLLFSQDLNGILPLVHVFDRNGTYISTSQGQFNPLQSRAFLATTSVLKSSNGAYWLLGYRFPDNAVVEGEAFISDQTFSQNTYLSSSYYPHYFDVTNHPNGGLFAQNEFGVYTTDFPWTPNSIIEKDDNLFFAFGEDNNGNKEAINLVRIQDPSSDFPQVCANLDIGSFEHIWQAQFLSADIQEMNLDVLNSFQLATPSVNAITQEVTLQCNEPFKRFNEDFINPNEDNIDKILVFDILGRLLGVRNNLTQAINLASKTRGISQFKILYKDGSIKYQKVIGIK